jgi:hypothetical protein
VAGALDAGECWMKDCMRIIVAVAVGMLFGLVAWFVSSFAILEGIEYFSPPVKGKRTDGYQIACCFTSMMPFAVFVGGWKGWTYIVDGHQQRESTK